MTANFRDVFAISKGTPGIEFIIDIYEDSMKNFNGIGKGHPVIILVDNDNGSIEIKKKIKKKFNKVDLANFCRYADNLYIVFVPGPENTEIEDLFQKEVLDTKINGKIFSRADKIDASKEYGKNYFAEKVIKACKSSIDFTGFNPIFGQFKAIIDDWMAHPNHSYGSGGPKAS